MPVSVRMHFLHCLGALDGKHIAMKCPRNGGSLHYNYKGFHSVIPMALVDAEYKFTWVEVGSNGSAGDAQVFNNGELREGIIDGSGRCMMKPFSQRNLTRPQMIFN